MVIFQVSKISFKIFTSSNKMLIQTVIVHSQDNKLLNKQVLSITSHLLLIGHLLPLLPLEQIFNQAFQTSNSQMMLVSCHPLMSVGDVKLLSRLLTLQRITQISHSRLILNRILVVKSITLINNTKNRLKKSMVVSKTQ